MRNQSGMVSAVPVVAVVVAVAVDVVVAVVVVVAAVVVVVVVEVVALAGRCAFQATGDAWNWVARESAEGCTPPFGVGCGDAPDGVPVIFMTCPFFLVGERSAGTPPSMPGP
ncbi:hypothetical protein [Hydrogenophaga sp.]|uniref:hypothetical protein n=1 Tax=Hydrogenophaga sp. TaxID=1904254 RepID=UPI0027180FFF|nr:hypothetical protein [Hydrogenophaga sp.]MDO9436748.1 hypothetical protein [Hydrogenophaga sp.]